MCNSCGRSGLLADTDRTDRQVDPRVSVQPVPAAPVIVVPAPTSIFPGWVLPTFDFPHPTDPIVTQPPAESPQPNGPAKSDPTANPTNDPFINVNPGPTGGTPGIVPGPILRPAPGIDLPGRYMPTANQATLVNSTTIAIMVALGLGYGAYKLMKPVTRRR